MKSFGTEPFFTFKQLLISIYGVPLHRVPIDPGFSCPNRTSDGKGGCTFCAEDGGRAPHIPEGGIESQIISGIEFAKKRYGASHFMAYVQAFTGTFASRQERLFLYNKILDTARFDAISIGTRPDCVGEEEVEDILKIKERCDVWVELGVQTVHDRTLQIIRRGHTWASSKDAIRRLDEKGIKVIVHVILGLPEETPELWNRTAEELAKLPVAAIKIHNLHIIKGSALAEEYTKKPFHIPDEKEYAEGVIEFIRRTPSSVAIARLNTDTPPEKLIAPRWAKTKAEFREYLARIMRERGYKQGDLVETK